MNETSSIKFNPPSASAIPEEFDAEGMQVQEKPAWPMTGSTRFMSMAMQLAIDNYNKHHDDDPQGSLRLEDVHIISFSSSLKSWQANIGSHVLRGLRWVVTYSWEKNVAYIEYYKRLANSKVVMGKVRVP